MAETQNLGLNTHLKIAETIVYKYGFQHLDYDELIDYIIYKTVKAEKRFDPNKVSEKIRNKYSEDKLKIKYLFFHARYAYMVFKNKTHKKYFNAVKNGSRLLNRISIDKIPEPYIEDDPSKHLDDKNNFIKSKHDVKTLIKFANLNHDQKRAVEAKIYDDLSFSEMSKLYGKTRQWYHKVYHEGIKKIKHVSKQSVNNNG